PFSYPNNSDSSSSSGNAAQSIFTNGRSFRLLRSWIILAAASLPVPDSPNISTFEPVVATLSMSSATRCIAVEFVTSLIESAVKPSKIVKNNIRLGDQAPKKKKNRRALHLPTAYPSHHQSFLSHRGVHPATNAPNHRIVWMVRQKHA